MKASFNLLKALSKKYDLSMFYAITIYDSNIVLQGKYSQEIAAICVKYARPTVHPNGMIEFIIHRITVTLTA